MGGALAGKDSTWRRTALCLADGENTRTGAETSCRPAVYASRWFAASRLHNAFLCTEHAAAATSAAATPHFAALGQEQAHVRDETSSESG
jgi:hypothetical protein